MVFSLLMYRPHYVRATWQAGLSLGHVPPLIYLSIWTDGIELSLTHGNDNPHRH
jgi:hypothetical protein